LKKLILDGSFFVNKLKLSGIYASCTYNTHEAKNLVCYRFCH